MKEFPIIDAADQQFGTILNNRRVTIRLRYNTSSDRWSFDLSVDDMPIIHGRRIVLGIDLIEPFNLGLGALFALPTVTGTMPDRDALPSGTVRFYHATEEEIERFLIGAD